MDQQKVVFVSGCFDVLHGGHVEFFAQAKALGDWLVVCVPTDRVLQRHKQRRPATPMEHRVEVIKALALVNEVVIGDDDELGLNFRTTFLARKPTILAVTEDDQFEEAKRKLCNEAGAQYVCLPKTLSYEKIRSTSIRNYIKAPERVPLRVDFAGGWLDVPRLSMPGAYVVNCAITPTVSLADWPYKVGGGLGGSAAYKILLGEEAQASEFSSGVGWQDPAIIHETGLCSWRSGNEPKLAIKTDGEWLRGHMALWWTGQPHYTPSLVKNKRDYLLIARAGSMCNEAVWAVHKTTAWTSLRGGVRFSYLAQLEEGMKPLPEVAGAEKKYCGGGFGGYALYLFSNPGVRQMFIEQTAGALAVEPYLQQPGE